MKRFLDYATQVSELEKMARLEPVPVVVRDPPALLPPKSNEKCLVCGVRPARACAACGSVSYCGSAHQRHDARWHDVVCDRLRDVAEDQRALRGEERSEVVAELTARAVRCGDLRACGGWDAFLGPPITPHRARRSSDLATRPLTLASTLKVLDVTPLAGRPSVLTVHVMAASQRELEVPLDVWAIAGRLAGVRLELALVGPELPERPREHGDASVTLRTRRALYGRALWSELGQPELVIGYDCGILMYPTWKSTILDLCGSGVPFAITTFRGWEVAAEARLITAVGAKCVLAPTANPWASLAGKRSSTIANDLSFDNAYVSAWR